MSAAPILAVPDRLSIIVAEEAKRGNRPRPFRQDTRLASYHGGPAWSLRSRSAPDQFHIVERGPWGLRCTCTASRFGRRCWHVTSILPLIAKEPIVTITDLPQRAGNGAALEHSALTIWTDEETRVIKEQIAGGMSPAITDAELRYFASVCQARRLSPIAGQIVPVRRGGRMVIQVTIHGLRSLADATGDYAPGRRSTFEHDGQGNLISATAFVQKHARGVWHEVEETAYWDEYCEMVDDRRTGERRPAALWGSKPRLMLAKVAEALALRRAFPAQLGSLYTDDELGHGHAEPARPTVTATTAAEISGRPVPRLAHAPEQRRDVPKAPAPATNMTEWWRAVREAGWDADIIQGASQATYGKAVQHLDPDQLTALRDAATSGRVQATAEGEWRVVPVGEESASEEGPAETI